ncbi:jg737 [Pararge aegeria aegeria]|uniref:Jg737 protein n=1 Tax=Pararge aegeria aegeria TaxID=348720 RepID=A0A8S4S2U9_9NEOP|nr:jg737 [Pararge aegeria aegeria]
MESVGMSYVVPAAECELELTSEHKGLVNAAAFIAVENSDEDDGCGSGNIKDDNVDDADWNTITMVK